MGHYDPIKYQFGDDFKGRIGPEFELFPGHGWTASSAVSRYEVGHFIVTAGISFNIVLSPRICALLLGEMLGEEGKYFIRWAAEELAAWGKVAYRRSDNSWIPMFTDGTSLERYVFTKDGYFGFKGEAIKSIPAIPMDFWGYALAYRVTGDPFMWEMARDIARGHKLGDIGVTPDVNPQPNMNTDCWQPYTLLGFLELYKKSRNDAFLQMAERIGHNLLDNRFHNRYFVPSENHIYRKFDIPESLTLLQLYVTTNKDKSSSLPQVWPNRSFFVSPYRLKDMGIDNDIIYTLIDSLEPNLSPQEAATKGDIAQAKALIAKGVCVDAREDSFKKTALHQVAISGHKDVAELLLGHGADTDARDSYATSPLHYAAENGHKEIAELLITKGADINAKNASGDTPLQYAAFYDRKDTIKLLLEKGATISNIHIAAYMRELAKAEAFIQEGIDINALDGHGYVPFHYAVQNGQKQAIELLIAKGADVNVKNWGGETPLHIAVSRGHKEVAELLIAKGADVNAKNNRFQTPLDIALTQNRKDIVELLLAKGVTVSIHAAAQAGDLARVKAFLEKGIDINVGDDEGLTPLHYAAQGGHKEVAELLIAKGADINSKDKGGYTPLYYAIWNKDKDMLKLLVSKGADVNWTSQKDYPPLHYAVWNEDLDMVKLLVENGSKFDVKDQDSWTAFRYAAAQGNREIVEFFVSKGVDISSFHLAACMGDLDRVKDFVEKGTEIDMKDELGWTPLYWAASTGRMKVAEFLIAKGADVKAKTNDEEVPLHQASKAGVEELVELLISSVSLSRNNPTARSLEL